MHNESQDRRWTREWALGASLAVHVLAIALLVFGLPPTLPKPEDNKAIPVKLVPPPKPVQKPKAKPAAPKEKPKPEKPREAKAQKPPLPHKDGARPSRIPVLKPVFQFGKKDAGPRKSPDGDSAEDKNPSPEKPDDRAKKSTAEQQTVAALEAKSRGNLPQPAGKPALKPADPGKTEGAAKNKEAKKLFSRAATNSPAATTAMHNMPRDMRAGWLCVTELREQLEHASPPYSPDLLPSFRLKDGTVMDIRRAAFRTGGQWYDVSYRCEIDTQATKVLSFAFHVGDPIPASEWAARGLPSQ